MTDEDVEQLAAWIRKQHEKGRHAVILVTGYDIEELADQTRFLFPDAAHAGKVDFIVGDGFWVSFRKLNGEAPMALLMDHHVSVVSVSP